MRRRSGVDVVISVGKEEWRRVIGKRVVGIEKLGSRRKEGRIARGEESVGVRIKLISISQHERIIRT